MADDADARWVLRIPDAWNGKIVVGVPGGLRSEFMGDYIFSDFVVQEGYAYVSTNKGTLNFFFTEPLTDSLACRLSPPPAATSGAFVHFYIAEPKDTIVEWFRRAREATELARIALTAAHERAVERTYLMGISNGGHVVRRLLAESPELYDGGIDWEGVYWAPDGPHILIDLPAALRPYRDYVFSGFNALSPAHQAIVGAGYPPDIRASPPTPANTFSPIVGSLYMRRTPTTIGTLRPACSRKRSIPRMRASRRTTTTPRGASRSTCRLALQRFLQTARSRNR